MRRDPHRPDAELVTEGVGDGLLHVPTDRRGNSPRDGSARTPTFARLGHLSVVVPIPKSS